MYRIERKRRLWKPYEWVLIMTAYGTADGRCWTRRGCERELLLTQGQWFAE